VSIVGFSGITVPHQLSAKPKLERLRTPTTATGSGTLAVILHQKRKFLVNEKDN